MFEPQSPPINDHVLSWAEKNVHKPDGKMALRDAINNKTIDVIRALLFYKIDVNFEYEDKRTPLLISAVDSEKNNISELLIAAGANPLDCTSAVVKTPGYTPGYKASALSIFIHRGEIKLVTQIFEKHKYTSLRFSQFSTIRPGNLPMIKLLVDYGLSFGLTPGQDEMSPLLESTLNPKTHDIAEYLIEKDCDMTRIHTTWDNDAKKITGEMEKIITLTDAQHPGGASQGDNLIRPITNDLALRVNYKCTPFSAAVENGYSDLVKTMLQKRPGIYIYQDYINIAIVKDFSDVLETLGEHGVFNANAIIPETTDTLLITATRNKNLRIMKLLCEHGANVNAVNKNGVTALMIALKNRDESSVDFLLEHGANVFMCANSTKYYFTGYFKGEILLKNDIELLNLSTVQIAEKYFPQKVDALTSKCHQPTKNTVHYAYAASNSAPPPPSLNPNATESSDVKQDDLAIEAAGLRRMAHQIGQRQRDQSSCNLI